MDVIKRDGRIQEFNIDKIKLTLERVSDELHQPLTFSDIDNLGKKIEKSVQKLKQQTVKADDIFKIVLEELQDAGFNYIAKAYQKYNKSN